MQCFSVLVLGSRFQCWILKRLSHEEVILLKVWSGVIIHFDWFEACVQVKGLGKVSPSKSEVSSLKASLISVNHLG